MFNNFKNVHHQYKMMIIKVAQCITTNDLEVLKYLELDLLGRGELEKIKTPLEYLKILEYRKLLGCTNLDRLKESLKSIEAIDALQHIKNYEDENKGDIEALRKKLDEKIQESDGDSGGFDGGASYRARGVVPRVGVRIPGKVGVDASGNYLVGACLPYGGREHRVDAFEVLVEP